MRACIVTEHFLPHVGGLETEFWEFARSLTMLDCEVRVVTSDSGGIRGRTEREGVAIFHHAWPSLFGHPVPRYRDLKEHVEWADVVHTTTYTAGPVALSQSRRSEKPCIISVQECLGQKWFHVERNPLKALLFKQFERFVVQRPYTRWLAISEATRQDVLRVGIPSEKVSLVYLGIDNEYWAPSISSLDLSTLFDFPRNSRIFLYFGRVGQTKGVEVLIDAIRSYRAHFPPDVRFGFILGSHPPGSRDKVRVKMNSLDLGDLARVVPSVPQDELRRYIRGAFAVVVPSITEGFGFSAAETSSLEVPIISSDGGSLPEVVSGKHLFFKNRSSEDLGRILLRAIRGEWEVRPKIEFSWPVAAKRLLEIYESTLFEHQADA